jgi:hypothetical protein
MLVVKVAKQIRTEASSLRSVIHFNPSSSGNGGMREAGVESTLPQFSILEYQTNQKLLCLSSTWCQNEDLT